MVASCQPGFPDPRLPSRRLFSESLGWGSGLSCLYHSHSVATGFCCHDTDIGNRVLSKHKPPDSTGWQRLEGRSAGLHPTSPALLYCWGQGIPWKEWAPALCAEHTGTGCLGPHSLNTLRGTRGRCSELQIYASGPPSFKTSSSYKHHPFCLFSRKEEALPASPGEHHS